MALRAEKVGSDKYQKIILAATKVFAEKGFYNAKVADVAKEAQVADGTIYLYFKNKDDLLISIFEESMDRFTALVRKNLETASNSVEKLKLFINLHLEWVKEHQHTAQVLQVELRQSSKFMKEYGGTKFKEYLDIIAKILEEGKKEGVFRPALNPNLVKRALFGAIDEMALEWVLMKRKKYSPSEAAEQISCLFIGGVCGSGV